MSPLSRLFLCTFILSVLALHHTSQSEVSMIVPLIFTIATAFFFVIMGAVDNVTMED